MRKIRNPSSEIPWPGLEEFQSDFLASRKVELIALVAALSRSDFKAIGKQTHIWKGFAGPYGFQELELLSLELEESAEREDQIRCEILLKEIEDYLGTDEV
ncbi:MAG: hypothetical protein H0V66_12255 [Bdellovibrionales bacterium]|nr:hypothetical protein [Bdellovibrionales bacterium]